MSSSDNLDRSSLKKTLEDRYNSEKVGGAYDAKTAGKTFVDNINNTFADGFTRAGENTNLPKKDSIYETGVGGSTYLVENKHSDLSIKFNKTKDEFFINQPLKVTNFINVEDNVTYNEISQYGNNVGTSTYLTENKHSDLSIKFNKQEEFYIKQPAGPTPLSNFKDVTDTTSNELSKHMLYFNNNRYYISGAP